MPPSLYFGATALDQEARKPELTQCSAAGQIYLIGVLPVVSEKLDFTQPRNDFEKVRHIQFALTKLNFGMDFIQYRPQIAYLIIMKSKIAFYFRDRKSTRLNSSHVAISYAVC